MKKIGLLLLLIAFLYSCQQTELQFSCDPIIDAFVTKNMEELAQLSIYEISVYELPLQRAIFKSWDAEKKREAWLDKLYFVQENESFNDVEAGHVQDLIDHIYPEYFLEENKQQEIESRTQFAAEWIAFASNTLEWSEEYIAFIVYRLYINYSQLEAELSMINHLKDDVSLNSEGFGCDCSLSSDFCYYSVCVFTGCNASSEGCGLLWRFPCDGNCF